jgi:hypothetical protein
MVWAWPLADQRDAVVELTPAEGCDTRAGRAAVRRGPQPLPPQCTSAQRDPGSRGAPTPTCNALRSQAANVCRIACGAEGTTLAKPVKRRPARPSTPHKDRGAAPRRGSPPIERQPSGRPVRSPHRCPHSHAHAAKMQVPASSDGIQKLLAAEQEAQRIVAEARKGARPRLPTRHAPPRAQIALRARREGRGAHQQPFWRRRQAGAAEAGEG